MTIILSRPKKPRGGLFDRCCPLRPSGRAVRSNMASDSLNVYTFCYLPAWQNHRDENRLNMATLAKSGHLFPSLLAKPVSLIPGCLHARLVSGLLNKLLAGPINDGDLDFMTGRCLRIEVMDAGIRFEISFDGERLLDSANGNSPDLIFRGNAYDFLLLATRREDSDTLFFQRRLKIEGDTDMGLAIKNFLDAIELESLPYHRQLDGVLNRVANFYERVT